MIIEHGVDQELEYGSDFAAIMGELGQCGCQSGARTVAAKRDTLRINAERTRIGGEPFQSAVAIFERRREGVIRRKAVIHRNYYHASFLDKGKHISIILLGDTTNVPSAMHPQQRWGFGCGRLGLIDANANFSFLILAGDKSALYLDIYRHWSRFDQYPDQESEQPERSGSEGELRHFAGNFLHFRMYSGNGRFHLLRFPSGLWDGSVYHFGVKLTIITYL